MSKDPAFLFYVGDWLKGTQLMSRSHKGAYMDLLMAQFANGHLSLDDIETVLGVDYGTMWESKLKPKFEIDAKGLYYNEKLSTVMKERSKYKQGRLDNLNGKKKPHKDIPHGTPYEEPICLNEDEDTTKDVNECEKRIFDIARKLYPGTKRGNETEFDNFKKKHKDWKLRLPILKESIERQIEEREKLTGFVPEWKYLQTYINNRSWEEKYTQTDNKPKQEVTLGPSPF